MPFGNAVSLFGDDLMPFWEHHWYHFGNTVSLFGNTLGGILGTLLMPFWEHPLLTIHTSHHQLSPPPPSDPPKQPQGRDSPQIPDIPLGIQPQGHFGMGIWDPLTPLCPPGRPEPLVFHIPQSFFEALQQRISSGSGKKRLPNSTTGEEKGEKHGKTTGKPHWELRFGGFGGVEKIPHCLGGSWIFLRFFFLGFFLGFLLGFLSWIFLGFSLQFSLDFSLCFFFLSFPSGEL